MRRVIRTIVVAGWVASCGLEGPLVNVATRDRSTLIPGAADNLIVGRVPGAPVGTEVRLYQGTGGEVAEASGQVGAWDEPLAAPCGSGAACATVERCHWQGGRSLSGIASGQPVPGDVFAIHLRGTSEYHNLRVEVRWRGAHRIGLVPTVERQVSVLDPEGCFLVGDDPEAMLDARGTAAALILMGKALSECKPLASFPPEVVSGVIRAVRTSTDPDVLAFVALVSRLSDAAGQVPPDACGVGGGCGASTPLYPFVGALAEGSRVCDLVSKEFLRAFAPDVTPEAFAQALLAAEAAVREDVQVCYAQDRIRVVFLADLRLGALDGNCATIDPFKWAKDVPGKTVFFTGGVHKTTPVCGRDGTPPACLTEAQVDAMNQALGHWVPNRIVMYDDGTHGDAVRDDRVFTLVLDLPYFDPVLSPDGRGVRIGYKYTYGFQGQGWTESEEWPGNQRLLELVDVNGDHLVVRMDAFGDEATNKDKANLLKPSKGGCGTNDWENEVRATCAHDTRERMVDSDGDCVPDTWPTLHTAAPILADCP